MCYFHLKSNIKRYKSRIPESEYLDVMIEINNLHMSQNQNDLSNSLQITMQRWKSNKGLVEFHQYFTKQWLESDFCNWQIYKTPVSLSKTNNQLEHYNCRIKDDFT